MITDIRVLHPKIRDAIERLSQDLITSYETGLTKTLFKVFETFRGPTRQDELFRKGSTKARAWQSAHQYGLAVDFVPWITNQAALDFGDMVGEKVLTGWSWANEHDWDFLRARAEAHGLRVPISWDRCHVQYKDWDEVYERVRT